MGDVKISILVPIYKVESYLSRCIDSVLSQDFKDYELILVDDGSPDRCPQICDEYAKRDSRIKVIHKENGGLVSARLAGFMEADGEYLMFLDSDDWLLPKALSTLYYEANIDSEYDIVRCSVLRVSNDGKIWQEHYKGINKEFTCDFFYDLVADDIPPYLHSGLYRADLFEPEIFCPLIENKISVGEDWLTNYSIAPKVRMVRYINTPMYAYFLNTSSMMGSSVYGWEYYGRIQKCLNIINKRLHVRVNSSVAKIQMLRELRFFFIPEISFNWKQFRRIQSVALEMHVEEKRLINPKYLFCIKNGVCYFLYTHLYRFAFYLFKLKCKKRKVLC